jgi:hypothetical protein
VRGMRRSVSGFWSAGGRGVEFGWVMGWDGWIAAIGFSFSSFPLVLASRSGWIQSPYQRLRVCVRSSQGRRRNSVYRNTGTLALPFRWSLTPPSMLRMHSRNRCWAERSRVCDVLRCSSSCESRACRLESWAAGRLVMSTVRLVRIGS